METWLMVLRGTSLAAVLSAFGCGVFRLAIGPNVATVHRISVWLGLILTVAWSVLASAVIAGAETMGEVMAAVPVVAFDTQFGQVVLVRLGCLLLALLPGRLSWWIGLPALTVAAALQAETGHAAATGGAEGIELIAAESLHLLAAGAWLGGLIPLLINLWRLPPDAAARLSRRFSPLGFACVLLLAGTGLFQASALVDRFSGLIDTPYGHMILVKLALFSVLLLLAVLNRFTLTVRLPAARGWLLGSVAIETGFGFAVILAAARLTSLAPIRGP